MQMQTKEHRLQDYILGHTSVEYQRLRQQALAWEQVTRRVLQANGLQTGMRCLDIGCGPGEVMRLMGEIVGPSGQVTGVDIDGKLGRETLGVLQATTPSNFSFLETDVEAVDEIAGQPFDVTFARIVLIHLKDPLAMLRKLYKWTKPGGVMIVQDYDFRSVDIFPRFPTYPEFENVLHGVFAKAGRDIQIGYKMPAHFVAAGVGQPNGSDVASILEPLPQAATMIQSIYRNLLPHALQLGLTTTTASQAFLDEFNQAVNGSSYHSAMWPLLISTWKHKAA